MANLLSFIDLWIIPSHQTNVSRRATLIARLVKDEPRERANPGFWKALWQPVEKWLKRCSDN
ncbi:MAG TPA: hypothetical protein DER02_04530 [Gammaproteobacteria bacterium]|nr:hypothetical protein [Gammaproteobacteria bacterium]